MVAAFTAKPTQKRKPAGMGRKAAFIYKGEHLNADVTCHQKQKTFTRDANVHVMHNYLSSHDDHIYASRGGFSLSIFLYSPIFPGSPVLIFRIFFF